jgi:predicted peptidase
MKRNTLLIAMLTIAAMTLTPPIVAQVGVQNDGRIAFGTRLLPADQIADSRELATSLADPDTPSWQAKGDQRRTYRFPDTGAEMAYRLYVPTSWDGVSPMPLVMMLHGAGSDESRYLDQNDGQLLDLAEAHGMVLVSPMGYSPMGAYGTCLRLPAVFGQDQAAREQRATACVENAETLERSERDVINVLEIVLNEYPIDRDGMFLIGHSMGSGGAWYLGAKYFQYWDALAPMSGPFVERDTYPWDRIRDMPVFMTEGTGAEPSLEGSRVMRDWMKENGFQLEYLEVDAGHGGMVPLVLPAIFEFLERHRPE